MYTVSVVVTPLSSSFMVVESVFRACMVLAWGDIYHNMRCCWWLVVMGNDLTLIVKGIITRSHDDYSKRPFQSNCFEAGKILPHHRKSHNDK